MVSSGTAKLIILVVMLTTFYGFFDYGIRGALETVTQPDAISEIQFARLNMTSPYSEFHNVSHDNSVVEFDVTADDKYGVRWSTGVQGCANEYFCFYYQHWFWDQLRIQVPGEPGTSSSIHEDVIITLWDDVHNYTHLWIDPEGGKEQDVFIFIRANSTNYLYDNITASIAANEVDVLLGGQLPRAESDFFSIVGVVGTSFLTGITAPFTSDDYPVVLSLINYIIIILAALALALFLRG